MLRHRGQQNGDRLVVVRRKDRRFAVGRAVGGSTRTMRCPVEHRVALEAPFAPDAKSGQSCAKQPVYVLRVDSQEARELVRLEQLDVARGVDCGGPDDLSAHFHLDYQVPPKVTIGNIG